MSKKRTPLRDALRFAPDSDLAGWDPSATTGAIGGKAASLKDVTRTGPRLAALQERLYAQGTAGSERRILLVLQGMDTSGKGGVIDHVVGLLGPAGTEIASFKRPTAEEAAHRFLWRIRRRLPSAGQIGVFDRSHYEDVLIVRVHEQIDDAEADRRLRQINAFEAGLVADGTTVIKCFLHIGYDTQRERLLQRLADPDKHWKFREGDIDERAYWTQYQAAYAAALSATSTDAAPWFVIPADHKWFRNWAVSQILLETLTELDPQYPQSELDVPRLRARLAEPN